ncbi:MAG: glutamate synthase subunit alpha, partial [Deltaproteobacteria bacterium]
MGRPCFSEALRVHPGRGGCGVGAVADLGGPSRQVVLDALAGLSAMEHRGGCLEATGDGAGLLLRTPRRFFERFVPSARSLAEGEHLSVGMLFFPPGEEGNLPPTQQEIDFVFRREGLKPLAWRKVPVDPTALGEGARRSRKEIWQILVGSGMVARAQLGRALFRVKSRLEHHFRDLYVASLAPDTVLYKAMATGAQLARFYPDLEDPGFVTDLAIFHRRYSTNTFSNWYLAQPFRVLGHNGEINTIKAARSAVRNLEAELGLPGLLMHQGSDSADLDRMVELLVTHGVPLLEALVRLLPAAWADRPAGTVPKEMLAWQRAVRRAMGSLAAWEGPAAVVATDGRWLVGLLDRMGLRPLRWLRTEGGRIVLASEVGAVPTGGSEVVEVGQLDPGEALAVDLDTGQVVRPDAVPQVLLATTRLNHRELATEGLL